MGTCQEALSCPPQRSVAAQISAWTLAVALHNARSTNWQSLQQAEEFPVVLITFSFRHQAVQLVDQLGFHLQEEATKSITQKHFQ